MIEQFLRQIAKRHRHTGDAADGSPVYATPAEDFRCRLEFTGRLTASGAVAVGRAFVLPGQPFELQDRVEWSGRNYTIIQIDEAQGLSGPDHRVVWLGG